MRLDLLTNKQKLTLKLLSSSNLKDTFYWTGGTLLAYHYLHHRKSQDLDFFSEKPFTFNLVNEFAQKLKNKGKFRAVKSVRIFDRFEFLFENSENLRIEFVYYNKEKKTLRKRQQLLGVFIDSLEDIAANKIVAYFDRGEPKDLFDLYYLIKRGGFNPQKMLTLTDEKFGIEFPESLFWSETFKTLPLLEKLSPILLGSAKEKQEILETVREYFQKGSSKFLRNQLQ